APGLGVTSGRDGGPLVWSPDNRHILYGHNDLSCRLWDTTTGREVRAVPSGFGCNYLAWGPGGMVAAVGQNGLVRLLDTTSWQVVAVLDGFPAQPIALAWSRDGKMLAAGGCDSLGIWDASTGKLLRHIRQYTWVNSLSWGPANRLASVCGETLKVWA